jgi:nucleotide-binding universal stress UspA family protein
MKLLIAYDGSDCAKAAIDDLGRAGLPESAELHVLTVADVFIPPPVTEEESDGSFSSYVPPSVRRAHEHAERALDKSRSMAEEAANQIRARFPSWKVTAEAVADSPAWAIIRKADQLQPDLVVVGAHGHPAIGGRLILGSVSQKVLYESNCSVRIAHTPKRRGPTRIIVGVDGSIDAQAAVGAVAARAWPQNTEARLILVFAPYTTLLRDPSKPSVTRWVEFGDREDEVWMGEIFQPALEQLRKHGIVASLEFRKGSPKHALVEEAEVCEADSIFLGAQGIRGVDRLLLGSVSSGVAARAPCSVEVVRRRAL